MTRKELKDFTAQCTNVKKGYSCFANEDYTIKHRSRKIGSNSGLYGWNWTLYYDPETDTAYVDGYRNF